jgi:hypothetical protein
MNSFYEHPKEAFGSTIAASTGFFNSRRSGGARSDRALRLSHREGAAVAHPPRAALTRWCSPPGLASMTHWTRAEVVEGSRWTGAVIDPERNARGDLRISADDSPVSVWAIPTDEERLIARHTAALWREAEFVRQAIFYVGVGEGAVDIQSDDAHAASVSAPKRGTGGSRDPADKGPPCH